ncbi:hypothetical protein MOE00_09315 [Bacillus inaquosorum]|uniref:Uncharacterized protein n=1 Tax=Bacillus inaquosorum TaxID=483913 RepID=A0A9Q4HS81_9BACI|nr:hypothetical protein [Bacillus inaquosorum]MCY7785561.1 hypothetical protein [Bacillus inaquosorum]MCY7818783.1 hypothetical protein [Bacillus inaquosorum]MCY7939463.1 hypothetical protein [Bacillus inaquosorum]MCY8083023.1 hypothetical protein [Bacillus inaquosorum]MCY8164984.1 hypothetical protein [Bacillus inaquosorum]
MEIEIRNAIEIDNKQYSLSDNKMDLFKKVIENLANTILKTDKLEKIVFSECYEEDLFAVLKEKASLSDIQMIVLEKAVR